MKHKTNTRALSWLLSLALMLSLIPNMALTAYAASGSGTIGSATYTISEDGALTVGSGKFTIENWASVFGTGGTSSTPNDTAKSIKSVTFESGATLTSNSSKQMFYNWTALESANLKELQASSLLDISMMFQGCVNLASVTFGSGFDTSRARQMYQMFQGCSSLTELDLSTFKNYTDTTGSKKLQLYHMFYGCSNLTIIRVRDDWNPTYVSAKNGKTYPNAEGNDVFAGCEKLIGGNGTKCTGFGDYTYAVIDGKDGKSGYFTSASTPVEHRHEFTYSASGSTLTATCSASDCGLTDHKVEMTLTSPAKTVYGDSNSATATLEGRAAFNEATGLNIGSWQTYVYYKKGSDNQLGAAPTTPGEYTVKVTISNVAGSSYTLTADYTIAQKEIGLTWADTTFHYDGKSHVPTATATGLVGSDKCDVTVTGEQTAIGTYTATASGLSNDWYKLPENTTTEFAIEGWVGTARYTIEEAPSPKKLFAAKSISHDITNGVLTIYGGEFNNADWKTAFANDDFITNTRDKITSVRFVKANEEDTAAKLTDSAQGMFQNWAGLKTIDFTNLNTSDVTWMGTMFSGCSSLTELDLSPLDTKNVTNMSNMFYKCSKLEKITVGANWQTASSTSHMFSGCNELAGNAGTTYKALFGNYINTGDGEEFLPDVNGTYAHVDKGTIDPGFFYNAHEHHLTYTVDQSKPWTITATCSDSDCYLGDSGNHSISISLVKPTLYVYYMDVLNKQGDEYDKSASPFATLTMQNVGDQTLSDSATSADPDGKINGVSFSVATFNDANTAAPTFEELTGATIGDIEYYEKGSSDKLDEAPTDAGTYTAKVTIGGKTASVDYKIFKRFHSPVTASPQKNASFAFGDTQQELITAGTVKQVDSTDKSTFEYALGENATTIPAADKWSKEIPTGSGEGPFYVFYRVVGDKNHGNAMESEFPNKSGYANTSNPEHESNSYKPAYSVIVISSTAPTPPTPNELNYNGEKQALVTEGSTTTGKMQYALGEIKTEAPSADQGDTTPIVIDGENKYMWKTGEWSDTVPEKTEPGVYYVLYRVVSTETPEVTIAEPAYVTATIGKGAPTAAAPTATATYGQTLANVSLTNPTGNTEGTWAWVDATTTSVGNAGTNTFKAKFTPTDAKHYKAVEANVTVTVNKATPTYTTPTGLTAAYGQTLADVALPTGWAWTNSATGVGNVGDNTFTAIFTPADTDNYNAVSDIEVTVTVGKANPTVTAPTPTATYGQTLNDVALTNPSGNIEGTWSWTGDTSTSVGDVGAHTFQATFTPTDTDNYNTVSDIEVTVTVGKAAATVTTAPAEIPGLTYTRGDHTLVNAGTANGGTMQYALGADNTTAPETGFADAIPSGKNAGTYYVWYKAAGDSNHSDSEPACVSVTIAKATMTPAPTLRLVTVTKGQDGAQDTYTDKAEWIYGDTSVVPLVVNNASGGVVTTIYTVNDTEQTEMPTDAGSYSAKAKIAATANYNAIETNSVSFTITKAPHSNMTAAQTVSVSRSGATGAALDLSEYLANATSWAVQSTDGTLITSATKGDGAVLTYTAAQTTAASATGNVVLTVTTKNYADYTLTVNFRTATAFTLRFESNGGTEVPSRILNENAAYGTLPELTRSGYTFDGWFTNADCTQHATAETSIGHADATVYAKWTAITRTITLDLKGHGSAPAEYTEDNGAYKKTYSVTGEDFALPVLKDEKSGEATTYSFGGWQKDGTGAAQINVTIRVSDGEDATYTALWVEGKKEGEVTFEKGTSGTKLLGLESMDEGTVSTENADTTVGSEGAGAGKSLAEVMKEVACDTSVTGETSAQTVAVDMKIQPTDEEEKKFAIESTGVSGSVQNDYLNIDIKQTVTDTNGEKTMSSITDIKRVVEIPLQYDLTGLYQPKIYRSHSSEVKEFTRLASKPTSDFQDATFYVSGSGAGAVIYVYTQYFSTYAVSTTSIPTHTVMFDSNGGTSVASQSVAESGKVARPGNPEKNGNNSFAYVFENWFAARDFSGSAFDFENTTVTQDMTLHAKWRQVIVYTVTFNPNDGSANLTKGTTNAEGKLASLPTPTRSGYRFDGWYDTLTGGNKVTEGTPFTADTEIYARWTKITNGGGNYYHGGGSSSSGDSSVSYPHTVNEPDHGTVHVTPTAAVGGSKVTITARPDSGYTVDTVTVTDAKGQSVSVTKVNDTTYTFSQPESKVDIVVTFRQTAVPAPVEDVFDSFKDLDKDAWYRDGVKYALENGIMSGMGDGTFAPNGTASRAMIAQILWNMEGKPAVDYAMSYGDVSDSAWYSEAIRWATAEGIMGGYSDNAFGPEDSVTREQLAAILYRYARRKGIDVSIGEETNLLSYDDASDVSDWAVSAMQWTTGSGLITGRTASTLNPRDTATRAEIATIIMRYCTEVSN